MEARLIDANQPTAVQRNMEFKPEYSRRVKETGPTPIAADEVLSALPPSGRSSKKVDLGLWDCQELVAFADVIVGWLVGSVAHIGQLMTDGARQREGLGRIMHGAVVAPAGRRPDIQSLRQSIINMNADLAARFWMNLGYEPTGEAVPYVSESVESSARISTRPVAFA